MAMKIVIAMTNNNARDVTGTQIASRPTHNSNVTLDITYEMHQLRSIKIRVFKN